MTYISLADVHHCWSSVLINFLAGLRFCQQLEMYSVVDGQTNGFIAPHAMSLPHCRSASLCLCPACRPRSKCKTARSRRRAPTAPPKLSTPRKSANSSAKSMAASCPLHASCISSPVRRVLQLCLCQLSLDLDRSNLGNARLQGLPKDTLDGDPTGHLFDWVNSIFFFSYVCRPLDSQFPQLTFQ